MVTAPQFIACPKAFSAYVKTDEHAAGVTCTITVPPPSATVKIVASEQE